MQEKTLEERLADNRKAYSKRYVGVTTRLYWSMYERRKQRKLSGITFSKEEFVKWFDENGGREKYNFWKESGFLKEHKPSVDRINIFLGYTFDNMQVITAKENREKGDKEKELIWAKRVRQISKDGKIVAIHRSAKVASTVIHHLASSIRFAARTNTTCGGFYWSYINMGDKDYIPNSY